MRSHVRRKTVPIMLLDRPSVSGRLPADRQIERTRRARQAVEEDYPNNSEVNRLQACAWAMACVRLWTWNLL